MEKDKVNPVVSSGVESMNLLFLLFLGLKLAGKITWSWWWVFAPLWGPLALVLIILGTLLVVAAIAGGENKQ